MIKNAVLELIRKSGSDLQALLDTLTDKERCESGSYEKWSVKDQIGHIESWKERMTDNIVAIMEGRSPFRSEDFERTNREIFEKHHGRPWEELLEWTQEVEERLLQAVQALSEEDLMSGDFFPWQDGRELWRQIIGNSYMHPITHIEQVYIQRGEVERATALQEEAFQLLSPLDQNPGWQGTLIYNLACHYSLCGEKTKAIEGVRQALQLNPELVDWSKQDPDLDLIREESGFQALYES
jgi:tetratricopeptide (TPR) repeat protein